MEIYEFSLLEFESQHRFLFSHSSSSQDEFDKICRKLIPQAGQQAVLEEQGKDFSSFIGANEIGVQVERLLILNGYKKVITNKCILTSSNIISKPAHSTASEHIDIFYLLGNSKEIVLNHNNALSRESLAGD